MALLVSVLLLPGGSHVLEAGCLQPGSRGADVGSSPRLTRVGRVVENCYLGAEVICPCSCGAPPRLPGWPRLHSRACSYLSGSRMESWKDYKPGLV